MKKNLFLLSSMFLFANLLLFVSCQKSDSNAPEIKNISVTNHDNGSTTIPRGGTISVDFEAIVKSGGKLDWYHIEIHDHPASGLAKDEYKIIDNSFKDEATFKGLKNAKVHKHVSVPANANLGKYHVVLTVVDEFGNSTDTEDDDISITIVE